MLIKITKAFEHNLKDLSVDIPIGKITAITGVSGSGKSTLLKDILAATGARRYSCVQSKTVRDSLAISNFVKAERVENLPITILIDAKSAISNTSSTVATVSGVHELLRNLFEDAGVCNCPYCQERLERQTIHCGEYVLDVICDERYGKIVESVSQKGHVIRENFFDKDMRPLAKRTRQASFAEIHFELQGVNDTWVHEINKAFQCTVLAEGDERYNPLTLQRCKRCGRIVPRLLRSRLSFNTPFDDGGGMCRTCHGTGLVSGGDSAGFIANERKTILNGGIHFVSDKGVQFTTLNASMLKAAAKSYGIDVKSPVKDIPGGKLQKLMFGDGNPIVLNVGKGKKKEVQFLGIIGSLQESFLKGKGKSVLRPFFEVGLCSSCHGVRIDPSISGLTLWGRPLASFLSMTFTELHEWCSETLPGCEKSARIYVERLFKKVDAFCRVSCGHLALNRGSNTLSGGELQRIRVCSLLNASINGVCYLLDEPSSGLHPQDVEQLILLLREICSHGNTVIMVEHNKGVLNSCDWIVDIGPGGGAAGGTLLFADSTEKISGVDTQTAKLLSEDERVHKVHPKAREDWKRYLKFDHLSVNNLKGVNVTFPVGAFVTVCGVSGSGKSTFLRDVLYAKVSEKPAGFGFGDIVYLAQKTFSMPYSSSVSTQLDCFSSIARNFAKSNGVRVEQFLPNSKVGKCSTCSGRGFFVSDADEFIGVCSECGGLRYSADVLAASAFGVAFGKVIDSPLADLGGLMPVPELKSFSKIADLLGIGYLTLSRRTKTLSKGEFQRLRLANSISQNVRNCLFLLDEPSRGLHASDAENLVEAIRVLTELGNTVVAVEHNLNVIANSDYIIEFGGTGASGGYLLYDGPSTGIWNIDSPTARALTQGCRPRRGKTDFDIKGATYRVGAKSRCFQNNQIHKLDRGSVAEISDLAAMAMTDFLSVAIPGNAFYSHAKHYGETIVSCPVIHRVNFKEKLRCEQSLYDLLGIKDEYIALAMMSDLINPELARYVFDDSSPTGKCHYCQGRGVAYTLPEESFVVGGALTKSCRMFLRKSLSFVEFNKTLKSESGEDLLSSKVALTARTRDILFYGANIPGSSSGSRIRWPGLVWYFLRNHEHFPDQSAEELFSRRKLGECPVCSGKLLSGEFLSLLDILPIGYRDIMARPISWISKTLREGRNVHLSRIKSIVDDLVRLGLGARCLGERAAMLSGVDAGMATLVAIKHFGFTQSGIMLSGYEEIPSSVRKEVDTIINGLQRGNLVFVG